MSKLLKQQTPKPAAHGPARRKPQYPAILPRRRSMGARGQLYELDAENALGRRRVRALARKGLAWSVQREVCSAIMDQHRESLLTLFLSGRLTSIELLRVAFAARHRLVLMQRVVGIVFLDQAEAEDLMRLALVEGLVARSDGLLKTAERSPQTRRRMTRWRRTRRPCGGRRSWPRH